MYRFSLITRYMLTGIMVVFFFGGCALIDHDFSLLDWFFGEEEEKSTSELMSEGTERMEKGYYLGAAEAFQKIKDRYPYSKYAIMAELKMADALFKKGVFDEAYEAYDEFEKLHPKNKDIPYVIYYKGMCHFRQITTNDRDQSNALKAKEEFERLIKRFPRNDYANRARRNIRKCLIYLSEYELYVGHYYYKMGKYRAAQERYSYIIRNYPDMGQYHEAMEYISLCRRKLSEEKEEEKD